MLHDHLPCYSAPRSFAQRSKLLVNEHVARRPCWHLRFFDDGACCSGLWIANLEREQERDKATQLARSGKKCWEETKGIWQTRMVLLPPADDE